MSDAKQEARGLLDQGARLLDEARIEESIALFDKAIALDGALVDAYLRRSEGPQLPG